MRRRLFDRAVEGGGHLAGSRWFRPLFAELAAVAVILGVCLAWRAASTRSADAQPPQPAPPSSAGEPLPEVAALVNGAEIPRERLIAECLARYGNSVLETIVNRVIIQQGCRRAGIEVTAADVDAEIDAMATRFKVPREKWIELIGRERGVSEQQYREEIVWPMLALRQLAHRRVEPTAEEIAIEYERRFGPAVKARIIVCRTEADAEAVRREALASPDDFGGLARRHSVDIASASANGWVQPIRRHSGAAAFDEAAFALAEGQISPVVRVADQFIILKCEGRLPAAEVPLEEARGSLAAEIRERKSREASNEVFRDLQNASRIENIVDDPARRAAMPGVAATVNGEPVPMKELTETCLERHGLEVLEILITRSLLAQALERGGITVTQADIDAEVAEGARTLGFTKKDGTPDVEAWLDHVTREQKVPMRHYLEDVVRPTVALEKLTGAVQVTREDLEKAYESTFGRRAKCRMIVMASQRRAQEVWQMARENLTPEFFGDLAERYSVDPASKALRGEVPPIRRYAGQPALEREAFALEAGELSGVVQVADRFMILLCEGYTEPADVPLEEVRGELERDIHDKKQRIEMAKYFTRLRQSAAIDNFLAGTSQTPPGAAGLSPRAQAMSRADVDELARPRAGSRGVVPASHDAE